MKMQIGGVHTDVERKKLADDLRRQLGQLIVPVEWLPRAADKKGERRVIAHMTPQQLAQIQTQIELALSMNGCFNYVFEHPPVAGGKSVQFEYVEGHSEDAAKAVTT